jgi:hypothetical protein
MKDYKVIKTEFGYVESVGMNKNRGTYTFTQNKEQALTYPTNMTVKEKEQTFMDLLNGYDICEFIIEE